MTTRHYDDLAAFVAVATDQSFTRAAARLGVSQSALSQTIRALEERLHMRLLSRTTRRVSPTELGQRLLDTLAVRFDEIEDELRILSGERETPAGIIRITTSEFAAQHILWPVLDDLMRDYPEIRFEITSDGALTDIVAGRFDAGIRLGEQIEKDMIAVPVGPEVRMAVVAAPAYFDHHPRPESPEDLTAHACIVTRMPTSQVVPSWEFEKDGRQINVKVKGRAVLNSGGLRLNAALAGHGLAYMLEDLALEHINAGRLERVLTDWCRYFPGFHLYYPSRRQHPAAFALFVEAMRRGQASR